jgi:hypothetical protein
MDEAANILTSRQWLLMLRLDEVANILTSISSKYVF